MFCRVLLGAFMHTETLLVPPEQEKHSRQCHPRHEFWNQMHSQLLNGLGSVADETEGVVSNGRDGQTLHSFLQTKLHSRALVHGCQQVLVLAFQGEVDSRAQQISRAVNTLGQRFDALRSGLAGSK